MVGKTVAAFGPLDILVNNGAVFDFKALPNIDEAHFRYIFDTNVLGLLTATKVAVANFNAAGGSIVNISSLSALGNAPNSAAYSASKSTVNAITKVLALELAGRKIRVNGIMPGYYDSEGALIATTPLEKRPGHPSDLSPVAIFLASRASGWMTGEVLTVSGGQG
jgi:3-oxoacyl-[acyl-carrier protein] reductase